MRGTFRGALRLARKDRLLEEEAMSRPLDGSGVVTQRTSDRSPAVREARRRHSRHGPAALLAMLVPALMFPAGLVVLRDHPRFAWLGRPADYPWELWGIAICGTVATLGGLADWLFHRG